MKHLLKSITLFFLFYGKKIASIACLLFGIIFSVILYRCFGRPFAGDSMLTSYYLQAGLWILAGMLLIRYSQKHEKQIRQIIDDLKSSKRIWFLIFDQQDEKKFSIRPIKKDKILDALPRNVDQWQMLSDERLKNLANDPNCKNSKSTRYLLAFY